jgi:hypothetical protein
MDMRIYDYMKEYVNLYTCACVHTYTSTHVHLYMRLNMYMNS